MFSCYSNSWCISTNIAQPVQTVISVNLLWLKQDSIFCFEGEGLSKYILFSFWPLSNPSSLDNVWMWRAFYHRIKLPQRVLETTRTPHASSQQHPLTVRGLNCLCLLKNSKFFVLIPRCDVCCPSRRRRQPCCVSRPNSFFYKNTLITPVILSGSPITPLSLVCVWVYLDWSALQPQHAGQRRIVWQLLYIHAFKMSGLEVRHHWAVCLLIPPLPISLHFWALLYVFSSFAPVSLFALCCNECAGACVFPDSSGTLIYSGQTNNSTQVTWGRGRVQ